MNQFALLSNEEAMKIDGGFGCWRPIIKKGHIELFWGALVIKW